MASSATITDRKIDPVTGRVYFAFSNGMTKEWGSLADLEGLLAEVDTGAFTYDDQITTFKSELSGLNGVRLSTIGVRDITQYTSAQGGFPGSSAALIDALYWGVAQNGFKRIQTPTTYLVHDAAGNALASAPISGNSASVTIGIFTNV